MDSKRQQEQYADECNAKIMEKIEFNKTVSHEKLLKGIALTEQSIKLNNEKTKLLWELRRTLAWGAMKAGLLPKNVKRGEPCPICAQPRKALVQFYDWDLCPTKGCGFRFSGRP